MMRGHLPSGLILVSWLATRCPQSSELNIYFFRWPAGGSMHDSGLESEGDLSHSPDILPDMDYGKAESA